MIGSFHFPLHPGVIRGSNLRLKPVMECKAHEGVVEFVSTGYLADIDILHPVIENLLRYAAEIIKGMDMAIEKGR